LIKNYKESKKEITEVSIEMAQGFPKEIEGDFIFCPQDNLNTDGIYPGKYTYNENISLEEQAKVCMENYDPEFVKIVKSGDILVGGYNFGTGSSREQAATSLKAKGIQCLLSGSFSETYKRNAINNGFLVIELPELVNDFKDSFGTSILTVSTKFKGKINFEKSTVSVNGKIYAFSPIGTIAQDMIVVGGLENWINQQK
jgi:homoaconitate hydratase